MTIEEIRKLGHDGIAKTVQEKRNELQRARFSVSQRQLKNVSSMRVLKKTIARLLTETRERGNTQQ